MHRTTQTNRIWTNEPVYWDSRVGNLDKTRFGEPLRSPLQHGFYGDSKRGFSIAVHDHTTPLASVQSVVSRVVSIVHCTAVRTPLRSVVSINKLKGDAKLFTVRTEKLSKLGKRNAINLLIGLPAKPASPSSNAELFNGNRGTIRLGKVNDFLDNLTASDLDKISLLVFKPLEIFLGFSRAVIGMSLKFASSLKVFSLPLGDIPTKVELLDHFRSLSIKDGNGCKRRRANIDANDKSSVIRWLGKVFFKDNGNSSISQEGDVLKIPSTFKEGIKSFKLIIEPNRNHKTLSGGIGDFKTRIAPPGFNEIEPSLVEPDGASSEIAVDSLSLSPDILTGFLDDIGRQEGGLAYV